MKKNLGAEMNLTHDSSYKEAVGRVGWQWHQEMGYSANATNSEFRLEPPPQLRPRLHVKIKLVLCLSAEMERAA